MAGYGEESGSFIYDVFLSFRGDDTRNNFIEHLHNELCRKDIRTFADDKSLVTGEDISVALPKAILESKILIIVFSKNYATSTWCLDELVKILDCAKRTSSNNDNKQLAFPIFYHVHPSDVRYQKKSYSKAMTAHVKRFGENSEKVQAWKSALQKAADLKGHHISTGSEVNHIEEIVNKVHANIAPKPLPGEDPVGLEKRTKEVISLLDMKPNDKSVYMLGIHGIGGIGKTELARALYNKIVHQFKAASFLSNVREKSKINGPEDLQKTLLSEMKEGLQVELGSTNKGMYEIRCRLSKKNVLLVLDDVDDREQLKNLAGGCDWFGPGSRIIITTRDEDLLIGHQVQKIYKMTELEYQQSLELFCQKAFKKNHPKQGYEKMSSRAVNYAKGFPLALKVIGSDLANEESLQAWEDALNAYERNPNAEIQGKLQTSYERLKENNAKQVFLDIACFFKGEKIEYVENILKKFEAPHYIKVLVKKSLLTVEDGCLNMHDLIQDMGREIVRQKAPENPGKHTRLWSHKDVVEVLSEDLGSDEIEGILLDPPEREKVDLSGATFEKMSRLRILIVRNASFKTEPKHLPNHLSVLDWEEYPSKSFPPKFYPKEIIVFNLSKSYLTLEKPFKEFSCLTIMDLSHNKSIIVLPDVYGVQNLKELRLDNCANLTKVHESLGFLKYLAHLSVSGCTKLRNFLQTMFLPSLEFLDLSLCVSLEHFPDIVNNMDKPLKIHMEYTAIKELPDFISNLTGLICIEMSGSKKLRHLPSSLFMLPKFVSLKIGGCCQIGESFRRFEHSPAAVNGHSTLETLHFGKGGLSDEDLRAILNSFSELKELIASGNNFVSLPPCIKDSIHLTSLDVSDCRKLEKVPEFTNLSILNIHGCVKLKEIAELPSSIQKVNATYCKSLTQETLDMLWELQVKKEIHGLELVMPQTKIPKCFDWEDNEGDPCFWARLKFPMVALALVFNNVEGTTREYGHQLVELHLVINGRYVPHKGYCTFRMETDHMLVCDLRVLFSEEEWQGLDSFLVHDWNQVQISYESPSTMALRRWGVFVYKQETKMEDVMFTCPGPAYSYISTSKVPRARNPMQELRKMIEGLALDDLLYVMLKEMKERDYFGDQMSALMAAGKEISKEAKAVLQGKPLDKKSILARLLQIMKSPSQIKLIEQNKLLRLKFERNETTVAATRDIEDGWKHQYHELLGKLNNVTQSAAEFNIISKKHHRDIGCKSVTKSGKLAAILKARAEELRGIYDAEIQDVKSAIYLNGLRNGFLEAQVVLLALYMDRATPQHVNDDEPHKYKGICCCHPCW